MSSIDFHRIPIGSSAVIVPSEAGAEVPKGFYNAPIRWGNALVTAVLQPFIRTAAVTWSNAPERIQQLGAAERPLVYFTWHRFAWLTVIGFRQLEGVPLPTFTGHEGLRARLSHFYVTRVGLEGLVFLRRWKFTPQEQIAAYMRQSGHSVLILPDSGGPYGVLKPGFLQLARETQALVVPVAMAARPAFAVGREQHHVVPLLGSEIFARLGEPLSPDQTSVPACELALNELAQALERDADA